jgi:hypothetical protein
MGEGSWGVPTHTVGSCPMVIRSHEEGVRSLVAQTKGASSMDCTGSVETRLGWG